MEILLGCLVGVLMTASVWLMLSRNLVKFLFGLVLISNVANLVIFLSGGLTLGAPPLIGKETAEGVAASYANALPQALVLTAIVIGFGLVSFTLILALRVWQTLGTADVEQMNFAERRTDGSDADGSDADSSDADGSLLSPDARGAGS